MPHPHRFVIVVPLSPGAQAAAFRTWWRANVVEAGDADDDPATWPDLNALGDAAPATHKWWSGALPEAILRLVIVRAAQTASITPPTAPTWTGWTRAQKISWVVSVRVALFAASGIYMDLCDQATGWNSPDAVLTALALKRRSVP